MIAFRFLVVFYLLLATAASESTLRLVNLVYRHGDRSPVVIYPTDPNRTDKWPQGLGWLSKIGMQQHHALGQWLRERYLQSGFMSTTYNRKEIVIQSSDEDRCLMSAYSDLSGLYPPTAGEMFNASIAWQPIPVHTRPTYEDRVLNMGERCPRYDELLSQTMKLRKVTVEEQKNKAFYEWLGRQTHIAHENISNIWQIADTLLCEKEHNLTWAPWVNQSVYEKLRSLNDFQFTLLYQGQEKSRLKGGPLLQRFIEDMKKKSTNATKHKVKMYMYSAVSIVSENFKAIGPINTYPVNPLSDDRLVDPSTLEVFADDKLHDTNHDSTVAALLSALQLFDGKSPQYAATVLAELHEIPNGKFVVRLFYKNETDGQIAYPLQLPNCSVDCPLDQFIELTKPVIPTDWEKECGLVTTQDVKKSFAVASIVAIVEGAILLLLILTVTFLCVRKRCYNEDVPFHRFDVTR